MGWVNGGQWPTARAAGGRGLLVREEGNLERYFKPGSATTTTNNYAT